MRYLARGVLSRALKASPCLLALALVLVTDHATFAEGETKSATEADVAAKHPLADAIKFAKESRDALEKVEDYVATFHKKERVGDKMFAHRMMIKNRKEPFSVYLRFIGEHDGREVIYVEGANDGNLLAHETGLKGIVGTVPLVPTSPEAMSESIHPITSIGMWRLLDKVIAQWEDETAYGEVEVKFYPNAKLGNADSKLGATECRAIESTHPQPRRQFRYHRTRLYLDRKTTLPVRVEQFGFPREPGEEAPLVGEYQYTDIRVNQDLKDIDFDSRNPRYNY
ncbi:MAG: DUF1571 domain-containing protein [Planctomycetaceae bacterium]